MRAAASEQDAAIYLTAAFTGVRRGELVALRWRDVDFARRHVRVPASYTERWADHAEVRQVRSVPLAPVVAEALARLGQRVQISAKTTRLPRNGGVTSTSALYRRYKIALMRAGLRTCASTTAPHVRRRGRRHR